MKIKVLLVDGNWNLKRNFKKLHLLDANKESCGGSYGFMKSLSSAINKVMPDRVIVAWDGIKAGKYRYEIYNQYKANRKKDWEEDESVYIEKELTPDDLEKKDFLTQKKRTSKILDMMYIRQLESKYVEADDLIAGYILQSEKEQRDEEIIIFSRDKDFKQMISDRVSIFSPDSIGLITKKNFREKNGYTLENELLFRCFEGDKSDCIQGVNGIAVNTLKKYFPDVADRKYSYQELSDKCNYFINEEKSKLKVFEKIIESKSILYRNAVLMNLRKPFLDDKANEDLKKISNHFIDERDIKGAIDILTKEYIFLLKQDEVDLSYFFSPFYRIMNKELEYKNKKNNNC